MSFFRVLVPGVSALMAIWVLSSFAGLMINPSNAEVWTTSLMWSLLSSLIVMPILVVVYHAFGKTDETPSRQDTASEGHTDPPAPFVSDDSSSEWPPSERDSKDFQ